MCLILMLASKLFLVTTGHFDKLISSKFITGRLIHIFTHIYFIGVPLAFNMAHICCVLIRFCNVTSFFFQLASLLSGFPKTTQLSSPKP